jgi:hypothetical protein
MSLAHHRRTRIAAAAAASFAPHRLFQGAEQGFFFEAENPDKLLKRRNRLTYSSKFDNTTGWTRGQILSVTADADGVGDLVVPNTTAGVNHTLAQASAAPTGGQCVAVVRAKAGGYNWLLVQINSGGYFFDVSTGAVGSAVGTTGYLTPTIAAAADAPGYFDITVPVSAAPGTTITLYLANANNGNVFTGDGTSGVYIARAQLEWNTTTAGEYQEVATTWEDKYRDAVGSLCSMWQDSAGTTPVTAVEQPVGLWLDKRLGLARGPEKITNGDASNGTTGWTASSVTASGAGGVFTLSGGTGFFYQAITTVVGRTYQVKVDVVQVGTVFSGLRKADDTGASVNAVTIASTVGLNRVGVFTATATTTYILIQHNSGSAVDAIFDNISCKEIYGNHATQATSSSRPTLSARVNMGLKSEQFDDSYWGKEFGSVTANAATAPDGQTTADLFTADGSVNAHGLVGSTFSGITGSRVFSFAAKANTAQFIQLLCDGHAGGYANFDLTNGIAYILGSGASASISSLGNGWYRCFFTTAATATLPRVVIVTASNSTRYQSVAIATSVYLWGFDARSPDDATKNIPAYQRVNTSSDYDTEGFSHVDRFDGVDDGISTPVFSAGTLTSNMDFFIVIKMRAAAQMAIASNGPTAAQFIGVTTSGAGTAGHAGVGSAWTTFVNGTQVGGLNSTTRGDLYTALATNEWKVLEVRNLDLSAWTQFTLGSYTSYMLNADVAGVVLVPAQSHLRRMQIRRYLASKVGMVLHT